MGDQEDKEKPAKVWQVDAIQKELEGVNQKLGIIIDASKVYVTNEQVKEYITEQIKIIDTKYGPIYKMFWALMTGVVIETAVLVLQFVWRK